MSVVLARAKKQVFHSVAHLPQGKMLDHTQEQRAE